MNLFKVLYHIKASIHKLFLLIIYRGKVKIGKRTTWRSSFKIMVGAKAKVVIGENCFFNNFCSLNSLDKITIGDNCLFGENVKIYDHNHKFRKGKLIKEQGYSTEEVVIGENSWICSNVVILKGTKIGKNCVIGAGVTVSGVIDDNSILKKCDDFTIQKITS